MEDRRSPFRVPRRLWPALKWSLFALVMGYLAQRGWDVWRDAPDEALQVQWLWLLPALGAYVVGWLPSVWFWREMLGGFGPSPTWTETIRAYYVGHLGKYVPGKATVLVIRAALLGESGYRPGVSAMTAMYETLATMGAGAGIAVALSPQATSPTLWQALPGWLQPLRQQTLLLPLLVVLGTLACLPAIARLFTMIAARMTPKTDCELVLPGIPTRTLLGGLIVVMAGWCLFAVSLGCVLRALGAANNLIAVFPVCLAAVTLSTVGGFVILIAPGGLGVREMLLIEVLQSQPGITAAQAFVAAWLLRAVWLLGELLAAGGVWWLPHRSPSNDQTTAAVDPQRQPLRQSA